MTSPLFTLAQAAAAPGGSALMQFAPLILIFGVFYLLVIRPQQKKSKQHQELLTQLKAGDSVLTQGGMIGKITGIKDNEFTLEVQQGVRIKVVRSHITGKYPGEAPKADTKAS